MVKGVNKTVIEVNNTGSKVFDRIVFYVSPAYCNLNVKNLNRAIKSFTFDFDNRASKGYTSLRKRMLLKKRLMLCAVSGIILLTIGVAIAVIF